MQEIAFYRVLVQCDDYGRLDARPAILKARLFPLKDVSLAEVEAVTRALVKVGLLARYSWDGMPYVQVVNWSEHQKMRTKREKYPGPSGWIAAESGSNVKESCDLTKYDSSLKQTVVLNPNPNPNPKTNLNLNTDPNFPGDVGGDAGVCAGAGAAPLGSAEEAPLGSGDDDVWSKSIELGDVGGGCGLSGGLRDVDGAGCRAGPYGVEADALAIAMRGGQVHRVRARELDDYAAAYPDVDVCAELRRAALWLKGTGKPPGSKRAVVSFLTAWLRNASARGGKPAEKAKYTGKVVPMAAQSDYKQRVYPPGFFDHFFADLSADHDAGGASSS